MQCSLGGIFNSSLVKQHARPQKSSHRSRFSTLLCHVSVDQSPRTWRGIFVIREALATVTDKASSVMFMPDLRTTEASISSPRC